MPTVDVGQLVAEGYVILAEHPWRSGKLRLTAQRLGKPIPKPSEKLIRIPPPWSKIREYLYAMSPAQLQAVVKFGEVAHRTGGKPLYDRLTEIKRELEGKSYEPKRVKPELAGLKLAQKILEQYGITVEATAATGGGGGGGAPTA